MKTDEFFYENEAESLKADIEKAKSMTEEEMQSYFNTDDSKEEFISMLEDELKVAESHIVEMMMISASLTPALQMKPIT